MSRIVIAILTYRRHKPTDLNIQLALQLILHYQHYFILLYIS
jgi:hypothetical protein